MCLAVRHSINLPHRQVFGVFWMRCKLWVTNSEEFSDTTRTSARYWKGLSREFMVRNSVGSQPSDSSGLRGSDRTRSQIPADTSYSQPPVYDPSRVEIPKVIKRFSGGYKVVRPGALGRATIKRVEW